MTQDAINPAGNVGTIDDITSSGGTITVTAPTGPTTNVEVAAGLAGQVLGGTGPSYAYPPGYEYGYAQRTTDLTLSGTNEAGANTIVTLPSVTYDGSPVVIEFSAIGVVTDASSTQFTVGLIYDDTAAAAIGDLFALVPSAAAVMEVPVRAAYRFTPAAGARVYSIRGFSQGGTGVVKAGAGGSGTNLPAWVRVTKA